MHTQFLKNSRLFGLDVQLLLGTVAVLCPYVLRILLLPAGESLSALNATFVCSWLATIACIISVRWTVRYPGIETTSYVLFVVVLAYAIGAFALLISRIEYNRLTFFLSFVATIAALYMLYSKIRHSVVMRIAVIADRTESLQTFSNVRWVSVSAPIDALAGADAFSIDLRGDLPDDWERQITDLALAGMPVYHYRHLRESLAGQIGLEHLSETSYGTLTPSQIYFSVKRLVDRFVATVALTILLPVMAVIAIVIRLDTPGPAIFRQTRIGYRGQPFTVMKFRTMIDKQNGSSARDAAITRHNDQRITRVGAFLRRSRLDELPQIINVLRGEMSFIGPRPEVTVLSEWYESEIPFYRYRHIVYPGVTGWAQVNQGHVTEVEDVSTKLNYDFYYIKNFSFGIDITIVFRTIATMIRGKGAK